MMSRIFIHGGRNRIGGNVVEISTASTSVLFDAGCTLESGDSHGFLPIGGLFSDIGRDGVFVSHYHRDHFGLVEDTKIDVPVYMGEKAHAMASASSRYLGKTLTFDHSPLRTGKKVARGDIDVTPFLADHSACDSYMFLAEAEGRKILYTGDFRSNGRKSFEGLLRTLPSSVDVLICEGTTLSRAAERNPKESELETNLNALLCETAGPVFVMLSAMNIDRMVTVYRSARKNRRLLLQDLYAAEIASSLGMRTIPTPRYPDVRVFTHRGYPKDHFRYAAFCQYEARKIGMRQIAGEKFVMCVRSSMGDYLRRLGEMMDFSGGLLVYSMWEGYKGRSDVGNFLGTCESLGLKIATVHTSGHADCETIETLIRRVNPSVIMPIHTEKASWFEGRFVRSRISIDNTGSLELL